MSLLVFDMGVEGWVSGFSGVNMIVFEVGMGRWGGSAGPAGSAPTRRCAGLPQRRAPCVTPSRSDGPCCVFDVEVEDFLGILWGEHHGVQSRHGFVVGCERCWASRVSCHMSLC